MSDMIALLRKKLNAPERLLETLKDKFSGFPLDLIVNSLQNSNVSKFKQSYSEKMKEFALTLYFYSPKAYKFLRNNNFNLPNPSTLRKWLSCFNCSPGFLQEVFLYLKDNILSNPQFKDVNLVFDAMSIRKQIIYDHNLGKNFGYVNFGNELNTDKSETLATEALVFQIVAIKGNLKCAVGYFFINKISSEVLSKLVNMCITKLLDVGVQVHNVTFDGTSTNITAMTKLGCKLPENPVFRVKHNNINHQVTVMLDACHMLKLARNTLADKCTLQSEDGTVEFKYLQKLNSLQNELCLKFANALSDKHIFYRNRKMNVKLAAQTISSSVADALQFLLEEKHPDFIGCKPTIKFLRVLDQLFDFLNSRDPFGKHFKGPIKQDNLPYINNMLRTTLTYLGNLKIENIPILSHPRRTFALGFITDIYSIQILTKRLLEELRYKYILTYKFSQDHLELLFSCIRSRGGNNDNPNVKQFQWALRKLMFRNSVQASDRSNCLSFDLNHQNSIISFNESQQLVDDCDEREIEQIISSCNNSYYKDNVLYYICGFVVRKLQAKINCEQCSILIMAEESSSSQYSNFNNFVSKGKLVKASSDVFKVIKFMYHNIVTVAAEKWSNLNTSQLITLACRTLAGDVFRNHSANMDYSEDSHEIKLIKLIGMLFCKVMCYRFSQEKTTKCTLTKLGVRQKLNKLILFSHV